MLVRISLDLSEGSISTFINKSSRSLFILLWILSYPAAPCFAAELVLKKSVSAKVVAITDGDTLDCLIEKRVFRIRLYGIDAPEKKQAFGASSKNKLASLTFGKVVELEPLALEKYGRYVAVIRLDNKLNVSEEMIKSGLAWWYRRFAAKDLILKELEQSARKNKLGIWSEENPVPPWEYR